MVHNAWLQWQQLVPGSLDLKGKCSNLVCRRAPSTTTRIFRLLSITCSFYHGSPHWPEGEHVCLHVVESSTWSRGAVRLHRHARFSPTAAVFSGKHHRNPSSHVYDHSEHVRIYESHLCLSLCTVQMKDARLFGPGWCAQTEAFLHSFSLANARVGKVSTPRIHHGVFKLAARLILIFFFTDKNTL